MIDPLPANDECYEVVGVCGKCFLFKDGFCCQAIFSAGVSNTHMALTCHGTFDEETDSLRIDEPELHSGEGLNVDLANVESIGQNEAYLFVRYAPPETAPAPSPPFSFFGAFGTLRTRTV